jgi:hypothetical protein
MRDVKIGFDIDGVLCDFHEAVCKEGTSRGVEGFPRTASEIKHWSIHPSFKKLFDEIRHDDYFWGLMSPMPGAVSAKIQPFVYITARPTRSADTLAWLTSYGFPKAKVITVAKPDDKIEHIQKLGLDYFVEDNHETCLKVAALTKCVPIYVLSSYSPADVAGMASIRDLGELNDMVQFVETMREMANEA